MAYDKLIDGLKPEQQAGLVTIDPLWADDFQEQAALGFKSQWRNIPILSFFEVGTAVYALAWLGPSSNIPGFRATSGGAAAQADIEIEGDQWFRHDSEIHGVRLKIGGTAGTTGLTVYLAEYNVFDSDTGAPSAGTLTTIHAGATGWPAAPDTYKIITKDLSGAPITIDEERRYALHFVTSGALANNCDLYGAQVLVKAPTTSP